MSSLIESSNVVSNLHLIDSETSAYAAFHKIMNTLKGFITIISLTLVFATAAFSQTVLSSLDGSRVDIQAQRGKVVVLAIGASWLPLSGKQAEYTNALAKKYAGKNVVVYFVTTDSGKAGSKNYASIEDLRKFSLANKIGVPVLHDADGAATLKKFNIEQVPSFIVLDKTGALVGEPFGGIDPKYDVTIAISKVIDRVM